MPPNLIHMSIPKPVTRYKRTLHCSCLRPESPVLPWRLGWHQFHSSPRVWDGGEINSDKSWVNADYVAKTTGAHKKGHSPSLLPSSGEPLKDLREEAWSYLYFRRSILGQMEGTIAKAEAERTCKRTSFKFKIINYQHIISSLSTEKKPPPRGRAMKKTKSLHSKSFQSSEGDRWENRHLYQM